MHHPKGRIAHTTAFVTQVVEHWLERETAQWVHAMKDRSDDPSHHERTLLPRSYISLHARRSTRAHTARLTLQVLADAHTPSWKGPSPTERHQFQVVQHHEQALQGEWQRLPPVSDPEADSVRAPTLFSVYEC